MSLKFAIIGCGRISNKHIEAAISNGLSIVALCDLNELKMIEKISEFNLPHSLRTYLDYKKMLQDEKLDLIAICTVSGSHGLMALDCMDSDVNIIIEKPITLSLHEADLIIEKSIQRNLKVSVCHQNRFNKSIVKIREAIDEGAFGKLFHANATVRWRRDKEYYSQSEWRGTWLKDGGALMNQCIHNIDLLRLMMGSEILDVIGVIDNLSHPHIETEDLVIAIVSFKNGSYGIIEGNTNVLPENFEETLTIFGEKGTVRAGGLSVNILEEWFFQDKIGDAKKTKDLYKEHPTNVYGNGHNPYFKDIIDAIILVKDPAVSAQDGRAAVELVLAIYKSSLIGISVKLPLMYTNTLEFIGIFGNYDK